MSWSEYMKTEGYKEYPCTAHDRPLCEECYPVAITQADGWVDEEADTHGN